MTGQRINPISYDMLNGETIRDGNGPFYGVWDERYNGTGNPLEDASPLSGGLGDLTDGVIASQSWNIVEAPSGAGPYVGWGSFNPIITFNFDGVVNIDTVTIYVDDSNGSGGVSVPSSIGMRMGGSTFSSGGLVDPPESPPVSYTFSDLNFQGDSLELTLARRNTWVMLSEVTFFGSTDEPTVFLSLEPESVTEDGSTNLVYTFRRTGSTDAPLNNVQFDVGGSANFDSDYTQSGADSFNANGGTINFSANQTTKTLTINPSRDTTIEPDETVSITILRDPNYAVVSPTTLTGTISDDDEDLVSVSVSPGSVTEDGSANLVYTFRRTGNLSEALSNVRFNVGGTATLNSDYAQSGANSFSNSTGSINFSANQSTKTITINPNADTTVEPNETLILNLIDGAGYVPTNPSSATGTITADEPGVSVSVSPTSVKENGNTNLVYTFRRTGDLGSPLNNVRFDVNGTATFNNDYRQSGAASFSGSSGSVNFSANQGTKRVTIDPTGDTGVEPNETIALALVDGTGYDAVNPTSATGTITNDDATISLTISPSSVAEDGSPNLVFTFRRSGDTRSTLNNVRFSVSGSATFNNDYIQSGAATFGGSGGSINFGANQSTKTVTLNPTSDNRVEPNETIRIALQSSSAYTLGGTTSGTGTIRNDDSNSANSLVALINPEIGMGI
ncbi:Calx-beta domain-containing protein [Gloeocapsa sp. PCC 73106]|uniref:Calx-beta domain-containing protein n=1 Tax=Gloeocapsa sp. PCC 73106 TaxID=102232 RepID=UPI0002ACBA53|nr:Calx-beta domain-containing protein [Gloeocapsa sp. PCC 73106]ELS00044.1 Calx-beta domain-containing protein [Gloeocapsa sp. PCC 73106]